MASAAVAGMAGGALVYYALQWTGIGVYVSVGGAAAVLGALAWRWFMKSAVVSEIDVMLPQFSRITFAVTKDHRVLARRILIEMLSRVAVQRLQAGEGRADEVIASLHQLFRIVKELLSSDAETRVPSGRPDVDTLAMNMLNVHLRPFQTRWHGRYEEWRSANQHTSESEWPDNELFRAELEALQDQLRPIAVALAQFAGYENFHRIIGLESD
ncbi:hypothetical protein ACFCV3_10355 [Kribbella sp. NPDC056345]|uniref:hypothetical protein n=1 Tax=Kribbella sp. NPDC056345 TaxID=3345789 RepID=UPI0035DBCDB1